MRHKGASRIEWLGFNSSSFSIVEKSSWGRGGFAPKCYLPLYRIARVTWRAVDRCKGHLSTWKHTDQVSADRPRANNSWNCNTCTWATRSPDDSILRPSRLGDTPEACLLTFYQVHYRGEYRLVARPRCTVRGTVFERIELPTSLSWNEHGSKLLPSLIKHTTATVSKRRGLQPTSTVHGTGASLSHVKHAVIMSLSRHWIARTGGRRPPLLPISPPPLGNPSCRCCWNKGSWAAGERRRMRASIN